MDTSQRLPVPTDDVGEVVADITTYGYGLIPNALSATDLDRLRELIDSTIRTEQREGTSWTSHGNTRLFMLLNRGQEFVDLAEHPIALQVIERFLTTDTLLSSLTANVSEPGNEPQQLHADQGYIREPWLHAETIQAVWMIDDFTVENGATRIAPGTHLIGSGPKAESLPVVHLEGRRGTLAFLDGRVWHGTSRNHTAAQRRRGVFGFYCSPYMRQQENIFRSLDPQVEAALSDRMRKLLGYDIWQGLGTVGGLPRSWHGTSTRSGPIPPSPPGALEDA